MGGVPGSVVVLVSIIAAASVVAVAAAMHKVYSGRGRADDLESADAMLANVSMEQSHYMRDVRIRHQLQAWGVAPAFEDAYVPPRSQLGRMGSRGADTATSFGYT